MQMQQLDNIAYQSIPVYTLGDGINVNIPFAVSRYNQHSSLSPIHRHNVIQINYIAKGSLKHKINNNIYNLVGGDIFVIPPYIPHQLLKSESDTFEIVEIEFVPEFVFGYEPNRYNEMNDGQSFFDFSYIEPFLVSECNVKPRLNLSGKTQLKVENLIEEIISEYTNREESFLLALKANLLKLLVILGRQFHEVIKNSPDVNIFDHHRDAMISALMFIEENYDKSITIDELAKRTSLSSSYFSYLFKTLTNKTYTEYLISIRITKAMELLKNTSDQVLNICLSCGFNSINHFNRTFKNMVGVSPSKYRQLNSSKI